MVLILRLEKRRLNTLIKEIFDEVENNQTKIYVPAMVIAELGYLSERKRIDTNLKEAKEYFLKNNNVIVKPVTADIIYDAFEINDIPELHDRIIAATSKNLDHDLITNDPVIKSSAFVNTIW